MDLQGNVQLAASPSVVWQALNNPQVLRICIPGCEEITALSATEMQARVVIKMGPVRATFVGKVSMTDIVPMHGYTLNFEGSGGSAGFAKGSSVITLAAVEGGTQLTYTAKASIAGKLGQIGGRMIDASARQLSEKFFNALKNYISGAQSQSNLSLNVQSSSAALPTLSSQVHHALNNSGPPKSEREAASPLSNSDHCIAMEKIRLLWFFAGVLSTSIGVWLGVSFLK